MTTTKLVWNETLAAPDGDGHLSARDRARSHRADCDSKCHDVLGAGSRQADGGARANLLLVPRDVSLQDYYAADFQSAKLPEENATQLAMASLNGVEHIAPKLSVPVHVNGKHLTLTGILPQSAFDAKASWQGLQSFGRTYGKASCKARVLLDEAKGSAAETLAKGRFVPEIAKDDILVGAEAALAANLQVGGHVEILGQDSRIAGVMSHTGTVDDNRIFAHLHEVQRLSKSGEAVNAIEIMACCEDAAGGLGSELRTMFPDAKVLTISQVVDTQVSVNRLMKRLSYLFFTILLVVGVTSIAGTIFFCKRGGTPP